MTTQTANRLEIVRPGKIVITNEPLPKQGSGDVVARTVLSGISHGTELAWYRGKAAALHKGWDRDARLFVTGGQPSAYPIRPGYETVARVESVGAEVEGIGPGRLVYLDRPHADVHVIPGPEAVKGLIPEDVTAEQAVFYPLARVALGGVHEAIIQLGDFVAVTGLGVVGLLAVQLAKLAGARVIGVDRYPMRLQAAREFGAHALDATDGTDLAAAVRAATGGRGADRVIEASGSYRLLHEAIRCAVVSGRVSTVTSYHGDQRGLSLGEEYQRNAVALACSMTMGGVLPHRYPAWDLDRLNATARSLVNTGALMTSELITQRVAFTEADAAYDLIDSAPETTIKVVLTYDA